MLSQKWASVPPALLPPDIIREALGKPWAVADCPFLSPSLGALGEGWWRACCNRVSMQLLFTEIQIASACSIIKVRVRLLLCVHNRRPSSWPHRACPDAPLPREAWESWRNEKLPSLMCREETRWCKEETMWRQEAGSPKKYVWSSPRICQQLLMKHGPSRARTVPGRRAHSPAADAAHTRQPSAVPCSWLAAMFFPDFPSTGAS